MGTFSEGAERYIARVGYGATAAAAGALIGTGTTLGALILTTGGLMAIAAAGITSIRLKVAENGRMSQVRTLNRFKDELRSIGQR